MKGITIWQPWAHLIAIGLKTIETQTRSFNYRGPLAIHAGCVIDSVAQRLVARQWPDLVPPGGYPTRAIVAVCQLVKCRPLTDADDAAAYCQCKGYHGLILQNVRRLIAPVPARGHLGLWPIPADLETQIRDRIVESGQRAAARRQAGKLRLES